MNFLEFSFFNSKLSCECHVNKDFGQFSLTPLARELNKYRVSVFALAATSIFALRITTSYLMLVLVEHECRSVKGCPLDNM